MTHAIHAAVFTDQCARAHAVSDLGECHAGTQELSPSHHPMCRTRDPGKFLFHCAALVSHYDT